MSNYTVTLRQIINSGYELNAFKNYPIFDESYRERLNSLIIKHFYFREIGFETVAMFDIELEDSLNQIMPYYNQLFIASKLDIDPLSNHSYNESVTETGSNTGNSNTATTHNNSGTNTSAVNNDNSAKDTMIRSEPADGILSIADIESNVYANSVDISKGNSNFNSTKNSSYGSDSTGKSNTSQEYNSTKTYIRKVSGVENVSQAELLKKFKDSVFSIERMLLNDRLLNECFMEVY